MGRGRAAHARRLPAPGLAFGCAALSSAGWDLTPRLAGELAVLEPLAERHRAALLEASRPPEIWTWWLIDPGRDEPAFHDWFDGALTDAARGEAFHFATLEARTGAAVGSTSFCTPRPEHAGVEIGWTWLTPAAWGTGINVEAKLMQLRHAFETLGCVRVEFETDARNERSRAALAGLPAQFEGVLRDWRVLAGDDRRSSAYYSILDREWPAVRANLTARLRAHLG